MSVSVIVPVHRGGQAFARCLAAAKAQQVQPLEVIAVADGAVPEDVATARQAGVCVLELPRRGGPARARNAGARVAQGDLLYFIDADVEVAPDSIARVAEAFAGPCAPAAIIGSYDDQPAGQTFLAQYKNLQHHYVHQQGREEASTFWGACGAIRKKVFERTGGFDESYCSPCIEDIELGYRLRCQGHSIRLCHDLQVKHWKVWTPWSLLRTDFLYRALPWTELILQRGRAANDLNLCWTSRVSGLLSVAGALCLAASAFRPWLLTGAGLAAGGLITLNTGFYRFLWRRRGAWFLLRALPWHWCYYLNGVLGFGVSCGLHLLGIRRAPWRRPVLEDVSARAPAGTSGEGG